MVVQWIVIMFLLYYFENTLGEGRGGSGVRLDRFFCVRRRYWAQVAAYWRGTERKGVGPAAAGGPAASGARNNVLACIRYV